MSVVAVKVYDDKIEMSADSIMIYGSRKELFYNNFSKIANINDMIIGVTGTCEECGLMWIFAKNHRPTSATERDVLEFIAEFADWKRNRTGNSNIDCHYLLAYEGKAFIIQNYMVLEVNRYSSIGAGAEYALAALYLDKTAPEAVKVACDLSCYVSEPIITYVMGKGEKRNDKQV